MFLLSTYPFMLIELILEFIRLTGVVYATFVQIAESRYGERLTFPSLSFVILQFVNVPPCVPYKAMV